MRRFLACILVVMLLMAPLTALGESLTIDLSTATLDDLIAARTAIEQAIMENADFKEVSVPAGTYVVGEQIPAGEYTVTTTASMALVTVYKDSSMSALGMLGADVLSGSDSIGRLVLEDGQALDITGGVVFAPYAGLGF